MLQKLLMRPGLNREGTSYANEGGWYDGDKIRFRSGFCEKVGGWTQVSPLAYDGTCRSIWTWADGDQGTGAQYIGLGTSSKYYIYYGGIYNDITPIAQTNTLTNPFSVTSNSNTVIVTDNNYEPVIGDSVNFAGATPVGGITIDGEYKITSIPATNSLLSPNTYTIESEIAAASTAIGGGTVTAGYEYPIGSTVYTVGTGWGAGPWGGVIFPTTKLLGANPFAAISGSNVLTITLANHGVTNQTYVAFQNATGFANIPESTLNTTYLTTVTGVNTFTVPMPSGFTSNATASGGGNSVRMTIQSGEQGWGESYSSGIGQQLRLWSNDNYGADLVIAPRGGPVFYWSDLSDVDTRAQYLSSLANEAPSIFDNTIFSFGATAITITTAGAGYKDNTYTNVQLVKETGGNAGPDMLTYPTANITVSGGAVTNITVVNGGTGAQEAGTVLTVSPSAIGGGSVTALGSLVAGTGYTSGTYTDVPLLYVSGPEMTVYPLANVTVTNGNVSAVTISTKEGGGGLGAAEVGTVLSTPSVFLGGGGAVATLGTITGGTGYVDNTYPNVQLEKADATSPSMLVYPTANITVSGGAVTAVELVNRGLGANNIGTLLTAPAASLGGAGSGFQVPVATLGTNGSGFEITVTAIAGSGFTSTVTEIGGTDNILVSGANAPYVYPYMYITGANIPEGTFVESINNATGVATISQRPTASSSGTYSYSFGGAYVPSQTYQVITSAIQEFIICFGSNPYVPGVKSGEEISTFDPLLVRWSDQGNAYQWIPQVTNQSGEYLLTNGSFIMGARYTRQEILVWTDSCLYSMQYLGAPYVWGFQVLMNNITVISPNCMITVNNVTYWMGRDRFYMYTGRVEVLPCSLRQYIFGDINQSQAYQIFAGTNEAYNEVWWYYVSESGGGTDIDKYVIYNYLDRVWYYGSLNRTAWLQAGTLPYPIAATFYTTSAFTASIDGNTMTVSSVDFGTLAVGQLVKGEGVAPGTVIEAFGTGTGNVGTYTVNNPQTVLQESMTSTDGRGILLNHEDGNDDLSTSLTLPIYSYVQSSDFDIGDGYNFGFVWRILPDVNFNGSSVNNPSVTMTLKPRQNSGTMYTKADTPIVTSRQDYTRIPQYTIQEFTGQVYTRIRGRQMAFRIESSDVGVAWQLGSPRIDIRPDGRR